MVQLQLTSSYVVMSDISCGQFRGYEMIVADD